MSRLARGVVYFTFAVRIAMGAAPGVGQNHFEARYVPVRAAGSTNLLAVDAAGNIFIVGTVKEASGKAQIRAIKTDSQGNLLAQFDFGGSSIEQPDVPNGAAVDPQGNLVIVGTTSAADFPLVTRSYPQLASRTVSL